MNVRVILFSITIIFFGIYVQCKKNSKKEKTIVGHYGFDWLHPESTKCTKVEVGSKLDERFNDFGCSKRKEGESFGINRGQWYSCKLKKEEWLIFSTLKICKEMYEAMEANAP